MSRSFFRTYGFLSAMLLAIVLGCVLGALWPGATCLAPLGTIFINLMFCIVVPLVFCSLSSSIACMKSPKRAGKIMGTTLLVFIVTGLIAAIIMVLDHGRIIERGSHEKLIAERGTYYQLYTGAFELE